MNRRQHLPASVARAYQRWEFGQRTGATPLVNRHWVFESLDCKALSAFFFPTRRPIFPYRNYLLGTQRTMFWKVLLTQLVHKSSPLPSSRFLPGVNRRPRELKGRIPHAWDVGFTWRELDPEENIPVMLVPLLRALWLAASWCSSHLGISNFQSMSASPAVPGRSDVTTLPSHRVVALERSPLEQTTSLIQTQLSPSTHLCLLLRSFETEVVDRIVDVLASHPHCSQPVVQTTRRCARFRVSFMASIVPRRSLSREARLVVTKHIVGSNGSIAGCGTSPDCRTEGRPQWDLTVILELESHFPSSLPIWLHVSSDTCSGCCCYVVSVPSLRLS